MKRLPIFVTLFLCYSTATASVAEEKSSANSPQSIQEEATKLYKKHPELHAHIPYFVFADIYSMQNPHFPELIVDNNDIELLKPMIEKLTRDGPCFERCVIYAGLERIVPGSSNKACSMELGIFYHTEEEEELRFDPLEINKIQDLLAYFRAEYNSSTSQSDE